MLAYVLCFATIFGIGDGKVVKKLFNPPASTAKLVQFKVNEPQSDQELDALLQTAKNNNEKVFLFFKMEGCAPCAKMNNVINSLASENKSVTFVRVYREKCPQSVKLRNIKLFPTVEFNGRIREGFMNKQSAQGFINENLR